ncbi:MAG: T9SS type A sorting domain-containing protein, partial [Bacteroidales bacterium]|nr:T9SS type A sorting domain-containing protein [Bacteroidales bacterium]
DGVEDNNGNIILVGKIGDRIIWEFDALVVKVFPDGEYISRRFERGDTVSFLNEIILLDDGNYMALGSYSKEGNFNERDHFWICKLDEELNTVFEKFFVVNEFYHSVAASHIFNDDKNNIIIAGIANYFHPPNPTTMYDLMLIKLNQEGDTLLTKYHHYYGIQRAYELTQIPNSSDYLIIGGDFDDILSSAEYIRVDSAFNIISFKNIPDYICPDISLGSQGSSDYWVSDTSFIYSASFSYPDKNETTVSAFVIDTNANLLQELYFDNPDTIEYAAWKNSMAYVNDTTIYIGGFQTYMNPWLNHPTILQLYIIDKELNLLGSKDFGGDANNELIGIMPVSDGGCLMYATRFDNEQGIPERDIRLIKILREDIETSISPMTATKEVLLQYDYKPYPNPATQFINIPLIECTTHKNKRISIFNINGKKLVDREIKGEGNVLQVDIHSLPPGIYLYHITSNGKEAVRGKFIKK